MGKHTCIALLALFLILVLSVQVKAQVTVTRNPVSIQAFPGNSIHFTLSVSVSGVQEGIIITESIPAGWVTSEASPSIEKETGNDVKWLLSEKEGVGDQFISYSLKVPDTTGTFSVTGSWSSIDEKGGVHEGSTEASTINVLPLPLENNESAILLETRECSPGNRDCDGDAVVNCVDGEWVSVEVCELGCLNGECEEKGGLDVTGGFLYDLAPLWGIVALVVICGVFVWMRRRRKVDAFHYSYNGFG